MLVFDMSSWPYKSIVSNQFQEAQLCILIDSSPPVQNGGNITNDKFSCKFVHETLLVLLISSFKIVPLDVIDAKPPLVYITP